MTSSVSVRDGQASRERLLNATTIEVAQYGIAGSRVDRIAVSAGMNKAQSYACFENKDALFALTFARHLVTIAHRVRPVAQTDTITPRHRADTPASTSSVSDSRIHAGQSRPGWGGAPDVRWHHGLGAPLALECRSGYGSRHRRARWTWALGSEVRHSIRSRSDNFHDNCGKVP